MKIVKMQGFMPQGNSTTNENVRDAIAEGASLPESSSVDLSCHSGSVATSTSSYSRVPVRFATETKYRVVNDVLAAKNWTDTAVQSDDSDDDTKFRAVALPGRDGTRGSMSQVDFLWTDVSLSAERFAKLPAWTYYNHFVGMSGVSRKNNLARNLVRMKSKFPQDYCFFPDTWILPMDSGEILTRLRDRKAAQAGSTSGISGTLSAESVEQNRSPAYGNSFTIIVKPSASCQGKGIFLVREKDIESTLSSLDPSVVRVAQRYIAKPLLLDGYKFDMRVYVTVTCSDPLRIFVHEDGLVRLATTEYKAPTDNNAEDMTMHLTNYAVNAKSGKFAQNRDASNVHDGHKRSLFAFFEYLRDEKKVDIDQLKKEIDSLVVKTLIGIQPSLSHLQRACRSEDLANRSCFETLGLDIILDRKYRPWLLEVNHAPSFGTDSELDVVVKRRVISDAMLLAGVGRVDNKALMERMRNYLQKCPQVDRNRIRSALCDRLAICRGQEDEAMLRNPRYRRVDTPGKGGKSKTKGKAQETDASELSLGLTSSTSTCSGYAPAETLGSRVRQVYPNPQLEQEYEKFHLGALQVWESLTGAKAKSPTLIFRAEERLENGRGEGIGGDSKRATGSITKLGSTRRLGSTWSGPLGKSSSALAGETDTEQEEKNRQKALDHVKSRRRLVAPRIEKSKHRVDPGVNTTVSSSHASNVISQPLTLQSSNSQPLNSQSFFTAGDSVCVHTNYGWEQATVKLVHEETVPGASSLFDLSLSNDGSVLNNVPLSFLKDPKEFKRHQVNLRNRAFVPWAPLVALSNTSVEEYSEPPSTEICGLTGPLDTVEVLRGNPSSLSRSFSSTNPLEIMGANRENSALSLQGSGLGYVVRLSSATRNDPLADADGKTRGPLPLERVSPLAKHKQTQHPRPQNEVSRSTRVAPKLNSFSDTELGMPNRQKQCMANLQEKCKISPWNAARTPSMIRHAVKNQMKQRDVGYERNEDGRVFRLISNYHMMNMTYDPTV